MVVEVTDLFVYPVKSCAGIRLQQSPISESGLKWDREWLIVDSTGRMVTQRTVPQLALIQAVPSDTHLRLSAPGMAPFSFSLDAAVTSAIPVTVWRDQTLGCDEGDAVANWLSQYLNTGERFRLVRNHPEAQRHIGRDWLSAWRRQTGGENELISSSVFAFADSFPFLICNTASLQALNQTIVEQGDEAVMMERFRPNIVVSGLSAYQEDELRSLQADSFQFEKLKICTRCKLPNVDPFTAEVGEQPWNALIATRRFPPGLLFGVNAGLSTVSPNSEIRVGQSLQATFQAINND
ncbi:MAG TPA: MOSC N-terminal beta barrel domain-containing protein [Paenalcaligenes sp.]|nr:MOSC N-terminal beta barrel domain-containing protein [Paenalcaligenes sp.]